MAPKFVTTKPPSATLHLLLSPPTKRSAFLHRVRVEENSRAASKQLHLPWTDKCHDYSDETLLQKKGISVHQIHAQRFHFSPPELDRSYSSIFDSRCRSKIAGLNWARSCLDSFACWRPATDTEGTRSRPWMEMDLKRDMHISGVVTQGVSKRLGLENPHVKKIQVWCRTRASRSHFWPLLICPCSGI